MLFVCTGNLCRSPSAAQLLAARLAEMGPPEVTVESAGTLGASVSVPAELEEEGAAYGLDFSMHQSRRMDPELTGHADLIIGMERSHVREIVLADPPSFARTFTLRELVRRGGLHGPRRRDQPLAGWREQIGEGRRHVDLLGSSPLDDIPDPMGGTSRDYRAMLAELDTATRTIHLLIWP